MFWNKYYPFQVWLTTVLVAAVIYSMLLPADKLGGFSSHRGVFFFLFFFGLLYSIPIFIIYLLLIQFFRKRLSPLKIKISSCAIGLALSIFAYGITDVDPTNYLVLLYVGVFISASFAFRITKTVELP